jgi:hypothetical protein
LGSGINEEEVDREQGAIKELGGDMSVLQFCMLQELAKELNGAGFPNIQDLQHRQGREFLTPDGRVSRVVKN